MNVHLKVIGILAVLLLVVTASAGCVGFSSPSTSHSTDVQRTPVPMLTVTATPGSQQTVTATPVPTVSPSSQVVTGVVGDIIESTSYDGHISWCVKRVIRGASANAIVESGNMFNQAPDPGYEYCLYQIQITNLGSTKYSVLPLFWSLYADGVEMSDIVIAVLPSNYQSLNYGSLMPGASTSGWIVNQVPCGANLRVYFEPLLGFGSQTCYIQL